MSVAAAGIRGDAPSSDQLLYNHTWCHPHLYISTFLGCICSVPFSYGVCSSISIQSMCLMHHLLDTHLGFVVACGVQIAGAETTAPICEWMGCGSVRLWHVLTFVTFDCLAASNWPPGHPRSDHHVSNPHRPDHY